MTPRRPQAEPSPRSAGRTRRRAPQTALLPALLVVVAALLPAACRTQGPQPPQESPASPAMEREDAAPGESDVPFGVFFLHGEDAGIADCVLMGERETGGRIGPNRPDEEQARARAVLDMAEQARWLGGNVVVLPHFQEDFHSGRLRGRVYRCGEAERRDIYRRAAAQQNLTVVPQ